MIDLDGNPVTHELYDACNAMTRIFHEHCMNWARKDDFPEGVFNYAGLGHGQKYKPELGHYWSFRARTHDEALFGWSSINLYVAVSDELGGFDLVGFYEEGELIYLISRVDTSWSDVWTAEYPHGLINLDNPWQRNGRFLHMPD
jgi:hypothetical protein